LINCRRKFVLACFFATAAIAISFGASAGGGAGWTEMRLPHLGDVWNLKAVAFADAATGWAVGSIKDSNCAVALRYDTGRWSEVYSPCGRRAWVIHLVDIALSGPRDGWAVGNRYYIWSDPDRFKGFSARMMGGKWKAVGVPNMGRSFKLDGVSVPPGSEVAWAVGAVAQQRERKGLVMRHTGKWQRVNVPFPEMSQWELKDVDCPSEERCWAVGNLVEPPEGRNPLVVLKYQNGEWTREQTPMPPANVTYSNLSCVSFPTPNHGWAAGKGVLLRYHQGKWIKDVPEKYATNWIINSVSFPGPDYGYAVGWDLTTRKPLWLERISEGWRRKKTRHDAKLVALDGVFFLKRGMGWAVGGIERGSEYPAGAFQYRSP